MARVYFAKGTAYYEAPQGAAARFGGSESSFNIVVDRNGRVLAVFKAESDGPCTWAVQLGSRVVEDCQAVLDDPDGHRPTTAAGRHLLYYLPDGPRPLGRSVADYIFGVRGD